MAASRRSRPPAPQTLSSPRNNLAQDGRLVCLASDDNGETWRDHAVSERRFAVSEQFSNPYAIGGCRELTASGEIVGAFTDRIPDPEHVQSLITPGSVAPVYFFKIPTEARSPRAVP